MKISAICLSAAVFSVLVSSVAGGACAAHAISDRDECLCTCLRNGYDCLTGDSLFADDDPNLETKLETLCTTGSYKDGDINIRTKRGPCYWDDGASRTNDECGHTSTGSCAMEFVSMEFKECGGGDKVDNPGGTGCADVNCDATSRQACNKKGDCCSWDRNAGTCGENV